MKILVIDIAATSGGALSVLKDYYNDIIEDNNEYLFLLSDNYLEEKQNIKIKVLKKYKKWIPRLYFDYIKGKKIVNQYNPDIILSLQNTIIRGTNIKQILYMHQALPFQNIKNYSIFKKQEFKLAIIQKLIGACIKSSIKKANKIIVQTNWIKESIVKKCQISPNKIEIIPPKIQLKDIKINNSNSYNKFFYPTSDDIYKNNDLIYKASNLLNQEGIKDFTVELTIDGISNDNIKKIGKLSRKEVFNKYSESILIFPSYIETFGLPLLEAANSNTIILAADTPFAHEILEHYKNAYFFNPFNEQELKELMKKVINRNIKFKKEKYLQNSKFKTIKNVVNEYNNKKSILWFTNIPSPYRVNFFNELGKEVDLNIIFERESSSERDKSWGKYKANNFKYKILKGIKYGIDKSISINGIKEIKKNKNDYIFISNYSSITGIITTLYMIFKKIPYIIETDGGFAKKGNGIKERIKKQIISHANKCFSTSKEGDYYYLHYGANQKNIVRYPFTSLYEKDIIDKPITKTEQNILRKKYKIKEKKVIISIGQFINRKGFDILLKAYSNIENNDSGLYIIGGTPTQEYIDIINKQKIKNVYFIPFVKKEEIFEYLKLSDLFVLATREDIWGLVINEAMACGLPIITTDKCIAGLELINNSENGYIVAVDDYKELANKINIILNDSKQRNSMKQNNLNKIKKYTFEEMAKVHLKELKK